MVQSGACATFGRMLRQFNENHKIASTIIAMAEAINDPPSKRHQMTTASSSLYVYLRTVFELEVLENNVATVGAALIVCTFCRSHEMRKFV